MIPSLLELSPFWGLLLPLGFMLQINLSDVSANFPWLLLSQTHTSIERPSRSLGFVWLLINSAYTAHNITEVSVRLALWAGRLLFYMCQKRAKWLSYTCESFTKLFYHCFFHRLHIPSHSHGAFLIIYKKRQRTIPSALLLTAMVISAQESKGQWWSWAWI